MPNIKAVVQYKGTSYYGFQLQPILPTIQGEIEKALTLVLKQDIRIKFAGRTDAGVHALCQVINYDHPNEPDLYRLRFSLNSILPQDIRITEMDVVPQDFDARRSAVWREYVYLLLNRRMGSPFMGDQCWHYPNPLDRDLMIEAATHLKGRHDFSSFAAKSGIEDENIREILTLDLTSSDELISFTVRGDSFLHHMVRNIVGTLVEVGAKKSPPARIIEILEAKDRDAAGITAPAKGLFLTKVQY